MLHPATLSFIERKIRLRNPFLPRVPASIRSSSTRLVGRYTPPRTVKDFAIEAARISTNMATQVCKKKKTLEDDVMRGKI